MADPNTTSDATSDPAATAGGEHDADAQQTTSDATSDDTQLGDGGKRVLAEARRATRAAEQRARELEARLREFEDRDKTELEKATERASTAETRVAVLEGEVLKRTAAAEAGIPKHWQRLVGTNADELKADAEALAADLKQEQQEQGVTSAELGAGARSGVSATGHQGMNERIRRQAGRR